MSLNVLNKLLKLQMHQQTPIETMPDDTPDFVRATLEAKQKQYAREASKHERQVAKIAKNSLYGKLGKQPPGTIE